MNLHLYPENDPYQAADSYEQRFDVSFDYPVHFTRRAFERENTTLVSTFNRRGEDRRHRVAVYVDGGLATAQPNLCEQIKTYFHAYPEQLELAGGPTVVPGGSAAKTDHDLLKDIMWTLGNLHLDRQSFVLAVGGGAMLDAVGFATSLVHRGLRLVRMPSTVLAQNDAGVGVKNGMDEHGQKNFLGTFAPPFAVINDFSLLSTLSQDAWCGGIAEALKVAIIKDRPFFDWLCENAAGLAGRDMTLMEQLVRRAAVIHLDHIRTGGDAFEFGSARPLDFGHWAAHKIEMLSAHQVGHGQAVAVGIALDCYYAGRKGLITDDDFRTVVTALQQSGLPIYLDILSQRDSDGELEILDGLDQFREHLGGRLSVTLPDGLGSKCEVHHMDADLLEAGVEELYRLKK
ncbi:MAG: 3-dehydroquinate synthase [Planctomycetia bacterium]